MESAATVMRDAYQGDSMWSDWTALSRARTLRELEGKAGAYRLRLRGVVFPRARGKSELAYFGETGNLRRRLNYLWQSIRRGTKEPHAAGRQAKYLFYGFFGHFRFDAYFEVSYCLCNSRQKAKDLQDRELQDYVVSHLEPPPLNQSTPDFGLSKKAPMDDSFIVQLFPKRHND